MPFLPVSTSLRPETLQTFAVEVVHRSAILASVRVGSASFLFFFVLTDLATPPATCWATGAAGFGGVIGTAGMIGSLGSLAAPSPIAFWLR